MPTDFFLSSRPCFYTIYLALPFLIPLLVRPDMVDEISRIVTWAMAAQEDEDIMTTHFYARMEPFVRQEGRGVFAHGQYIPFTTHRRLVLECALWTCAGCAYKDAVEDRLRKLGHDCGFVVL
jgi:hypothetical protein